MVNRQKLTEKVLRDAEPAEGRDYQIFDTEVRGFAACIYRGGGRAFTLDYRYAGRQRRMTFARWPEWGVSAARERAKELRREIDAGGDPLATRGALREAPRITDLIDRYAEVHLPHLAALNAADQRSMMEKFIRPAWGRKLVTEVSCYDVELLLTKVAEGRARPAKQKPNNRARKLQGAKPTPVRANRVGEVVRKMFAYAVKWGWREDNPAMGFRRRMETPRERYLSQEELSRLASALDMAEDDRASGIIRLPERHFIFVGDSSFGTHDLVQALTQRATLISRLRLDANLFERPPERSRHGLGRPARKGVTLPKLKTLLSNPATVWQRICVSA